MAQPSLENTGPYAYDEAAGATDKRTGDRTRWKRQSMLLNADTGGNSHITSLTSVQCL